IDGRESVGADDEEQLGPPVAALGESLEGVDGVGDRLVPQFHVRRAPVLMLRNRQRNHRESLERRRHRLGAMRGRLRRDDIHPPEIQLRFRGMTDIEVADMDRIEGPPEDPDAAVRHAWTGTLYQAADWREAASRRHIASSSPATPSPVAAE